VWVAGRGALSVIKAKLKAVMATRPDTVLESTLLVNGALVKLSVDGELVGKFL